MILHNVLQKQLVDSVGPPALDPEIKTGSWKEPGSASVSFSTDDNCDCHQMYFYRVH